MSSDTNTVTRAQLADAITNHAKVPLADSASLVDNLLEEISKSLEIEQFIKISSFGTFTVHQKNARIGRNPKTKVEVTIQPRKVITFKASNLLKDDL